MAKCLHTKLMETDAANPPLFSLKSHPTLFIHVVAIDVHRKESGWLCPEVVQPGHTDILDRTKDLRGTLSVPQNKVLQVVKTSKFFPPSKAPMPPTDLTQGWQLQGNPI